MKTAHHSRRGITLVEVMIAMSVVTLSFLGAFGVASQCVRIVSDLRDETRAMMAVQSELERLRAAEAPVVSTPMHTDHAAVLAGLRQARGEVRVSDVPGRPGMQAATVCITWVSANGAPRRMDFSTLIVPKEDGS